MATNISTFLAQVEILLGADDSNTELDDSEIQANIKAAVERYSRNRADEATTDVTGDGGKYYDIATDLTSWVEGFSSITSIEYPAATVASDEAPVYLDPDDWNENYWASSTRYLYLPNHAPAATETMRITYTAPYTFDGSDNTDVPTQDFYAVCQLAAGLCCQAIATKYSRTNDSTIAADAVNHTSRAAEFAQRARDYIGTYEEHMGLATGDDGLPLVPPDGEFVDWDTAPSWPLGRRYLYHGPETR